MEYYSLDDVRGVKDLIELGGTANHFSTAYSGVRIRLTDDGEAVFIQDIYSDNLGEIEVEEIEYFGPIPLVLDMLNMDEEEFEKNYGGTVQGFTYNNKLYLFEEFIRDDYGR